MSNNIIIKKLEDRIFDSSSEALDRLNDLGRNDIDSEAYKDLADQVRSTCPCNCYWGKKKRLKVTVNYNGSSVLKEDSLYKSGNGGTVQMYHNYKLEGSGTGYIEIGNTSGTINVTGTISMRQEVAGQDIDEFDPGRNTACNSQNTKTGQTTFSIRLSDDCKKWIFSYNPVWFAGFLDEFSGECFTSVDEIQSTFDYLKNNNQPVEEVYPDVNENTEASGSMKLVYRVNVDEDRPDSDPDSTIYWHIFQNQELELTATVTPLDNSSNNLNLINELYNDLEDNLK